MKQAVNHGITTLMSLNAVSNKEHHLLLSVSGQFSFPFSVGVGTPGCNVQVYQPWGYNSI